MNDPERRHAAELDSRVARLESIEQIRQLPERYAHAYAALDVERLAELYLDDVPGASADGTPERPEDRFAAVCSGDAGVRLALLHVGSHVIDLDGDRATGRVLCHGEVERGDGSWFHQAIHYGDRYELRDGRWLFAEQRRHELFYGTPAGERPNGLPPADWPEHDVGRGTVPNRWASWRSFTDRRPAD